MPYFDEPVGRVKIWGNGDCVTEVCEAEQIFFVTSNSSLAYCEKTCLTGPLEYKYRVIFVFVLDGIWRQLDNK